MQPIGLGVQPGRKIARMVQVRGRVLRRINLQLLVGELPEQLVHVVPAGRFPSDERSVR